MKVKDLIEKLKKYEDFEVEFSFDDEKLYPYPWMNLRTFVNIEVADIGHSGKIVKLTGEETK